MPSEDSPLSKTGVPNAYRKQQRRIQRELEGRLEGQLSKYTKKISELVGELVPPKPVLTREDLNSLHKKVDSTLTIVISNFDADWEKLPSEEIHRRLQNFFDKLLRQFIEVPTGEKAIPYLQKDLKETLRPRFDNREQATFYETSEAAGWLIAQLFQKGRISEAQSFFSNFAKSEDAFSMAQIYVQSLLPAIRRIGTLEEKPLTKGRIQSLIRDYGLLAGVYEKLCRIIVVLNRIRLDEPPNYEDLGRRGLAGVLKEIRNDPPLKPIASKASTMIRNSIAHPSYRIYYSKRRIRFGRESDVTWNQFRKKTIDLSIAIVALTITPFLHYLDNLLKMLEPMLASEPKDSVGVAD